MPERQALTYEQARQLAARGDVADVVDLAAHPDTPPEVLYYLAQNGTVSVRTTVARNPKAPLPAELMLARDADDGVRESLTGRIIDEIPVGDAPGERLLKLLEILIHDPLESIRQRLADALPLSRFLPKSLLKPLALDPVEAVAVPVVRDTTQFIDADFVEIIDHTPHPGVLETIVLRPDVSPFVRERAQAQQRVLDLALLLNANNASKANLLSLHHAGQLSSERLLKETMAGNRSFVAGGLALLLKRPEVTIHRLCKLQSPKAIAALCWKAGLPASLCYHIQLRIAGIPPRLALEPVSDGYALGDGELADLWGIYGEVG